MIKENTVKTMKEYLGINPKHLEQVNESYWQHLRWTIRSFCHLTLVAIVGLLHGLMPFLFADVPDRMILPWVRAFLKRRERTGQADIREL